jgi:DNA-binding transcriptional regulator PaaX
MRYEGGPGPLIILGYSGHLASIWRSLMIFPSEVEDNVDRDVDGDEEAPSSAQVANFV